MIKNPYRQIKKCIDWNDYKNAGYETIRFIFSTFCILSIFIWYPFYINYLDKKEKDTKFYE